jgi:hypothetical protein
MDFETGTPLPPPSEGRIRWFEATYRVHLPSEYLEALRKGNGGVPMRKLFNQGRKERLVERMLCLMDHPKEDQVNGWYDMSVVLSHLDSRLIDDENLIGMNVIPISALFGGDYVCLDFRTSPKSPTVAVWDHETSEDFAPVLDTVSPSFAAFDSLLK